MDTLIDLVHTIQSDLTVTADSTLFNETTIKLALNRAYRKAGGVFRWPELEDALKTSTIANQEYYDYPNNWRPDSMWKLTIDGEDYGDPLVFKDYLYEKENEIPSGADFLWSSQWRRFFVYPTPTTNGDNNMVVWGVKVVSTMTLDTDITIFSYSMPECNEAIVLEALAILKSKGENDASSQFKSNEAKQILAIAFGKIKQEQDKYRRTTPFLNVPDFFSGRNAVEDKIGNF